METLISIAAFTTLTALWLAFAAALVFNREWLDQAWSTFRRWPLPIQLLVALLVLPVIMGLWIWETRWPAWLRLALVAGLGWMTLYTFFPRFLIA